MAYRNQTTDCCKGAARLRVTLTANHNINQVRALANAVEQAIERQRNGTGDFRLSLPYADKSAVARRLEPQKHMILMRLFKEKWGSVTQAIAK